MESCLQRPARSKEGLREKCECLLARGGINESTLNQRHTKESRIYLRSTERTHFEGLPGQPSARPRCHCDVFRPRVSPPAAVRTKRGGTKCLYQSETQHLCLETLQAVQPMAARDVDLISWACNNALHATQITGAVRLRSVNEL